MQRFGIWLLALLAGGAASAQSVALKSEGREAAYVETITARAQKIVDKLAVEGDKALAVRNIIANRYFELNDIYARRDERVQAAKAETIPAEVRQAEIKAADDEKDRQLYRTHFAFPAALSLYLDDAAIEAVKDGMTYGVVKVTYDATLDMIPSLTDEEKAQILAWLKEAREFAMDAENSRKKHEAFGKYKGRINNYLSQRGYDLVKEREAWYKRIEARK